MDTQTTKVEYLKRQMDSAIEKCRYAEAEQIYFNAKRIVESELELSEFQKKYASVKVMLDNEIKANIAAQQEKQAIIEKETKIRGKAVLAGVSFLISVFFSFLYLLISQRYVITIFDAVSWLLPGQAFCIALAIIMMRSKKDLATLIVFGVNSLLSIYYIFLSFNISNIFDLLTSAILFIMVLFAINPNFNKYKSLIKKIWFVPATIYLLSSIISILPSITEGYFFITFALFISWVIDAIGYLFVGLWLKED